jgi:hypothetical protein
MDPREQLERLLKVKAAFPTADAMPVVDDLLRRLPFSPHEHDRAERGLTTESRFADVFSALPWTRLIHGLDQRQLPSESKTTLQVPDFLAIVQPADIHNESAVLLDTKLASGQKETLELQLSQMDCLQRYAGVLALPLLLAVFWERLHMWTVHTPDQFRTAERHARLSLSHALRNDLAVIFSDSVIPITTTWRRRTTYDPNAEGFHLRHPDRGWIIEDHLATDGKTFVKLSEVESGVLTRLAPFKTLETTIDGPRRTILSENGTERATKLSSVVHLLLEDFDGFGDDTQPDIAFNTFVKFKVDANVATFPGLPEKPTPQVTTLFEHVFGFTWNDESTAGASG